MLRFAVYDETGPAAEWPLTNAHLLGPDELPVAGRITFRDGEIRCEKRGTKAAALCLQFEAGSMGRLMLQTCLLPDRQEPYLLSAELARHRIKTFIAKSEEWQMFDLSAQHPAMLQWEKARQRLTEALITSEDPLAADRFARAALELAIDSTERLAMAHAEILLHRRYASRAASSATLGVRVWPGRDGKNLRELIASNFDLIVLPIRWREIEVEEGKYKWDALDRWMEWASRQGKPILAGPLIDFSKHALPDWIYVWQHDYDTSRDLVYEYMERVVARYKSIVSMWNIASGINVNDNFQLLPSQMIDLARTASLLVRHSRRGARGMIELREPFGEHSSDTSESMPPLAFIDRLIQEGVKFDAIGLQLLFGQAAQGRTTRDLMQISSLLDKYFLMEIPILISAAGVPSETIDPDGGWWHEKWTPELQASWIARVFAIVMSKPFVESIFWTDLYDHDESVLPRAGLLANDGQPKPVFSRLISIRRRLRKPLGPLKLPAAVKPA